MIMKKMVCLLLVLFLIVSFVSCGSSNDAIQSNTTNQDKGINVGDTVELGYYGDDNLTEKIYDYMREDNDTIDWSIPIVWEVVDYDSEHNLLTLLSIKGLWKQKRSWGGLENDYLKSDEMEFFIKNAFSEEQRNHMGYWTINTAAESHDYNIMIPFIDDIRAWYSTSNERKCYNIEAEPCSYWLLGDSVVLENGDIEYVTGHGDTVEGYIRPMILIDKDYVDSFL